MDMALALAAEGGELGEVPVGALVVDGAGRIVGQGRNAPVSSSDPTAHAEILALREAGRTVGNYRLGGCVCVVTLEPCPMCAAALVHARVDGLVYGAADARAGAVISRTECLDGSFASHRVWHMGGIRSLECLELLQRFFRERRAGAP
ncbi:MAG: nucleoside deaminase [Desulfovibrio sp.]|jgi:tRNA(adenine34) deaminase|nr:nucleoside deaminase [Desulfovibrio sp.]